MFQRYSQKNGFTIIELMLSMTFVSILLVSIAILTIQISHLYTKGLTMKEVNQAGSEVTNDIRSTIATSYADRVKFKQNGGRKLLCSGEYTYIANDPQHISTPTSSDLIKFTNGTIVRFAKVRDLGGTLCSVSSLPSKLNSDAVELLAGGDRGLVVRDLSLAPQSAFNADLATGRMLYIIDLTLSTEVTNELDLVNDSCKPPSDAVNSGAEWCAIDKFSIVARVGNTYKK